MPGIGGTGDNAVNETISSNTLLTSAGSLALSLASAFGAVELGKYAANQGSFVVATGNPSNPVQVIPGSQVNLAQQQQQLQQQNVIGYVVVGAAVLLLGLVVLAIVR